MVGFYGHNIVPVVSVKAESFFTGLSVQISLRNFTTTLGLWLICYTLLIQRRTTEILNIANEITVQ